MNSAQVPQNQNQPSIILNISGFGRIQEKSVDLSTGRLEINGQNDSGKTTLGLAIMAIATGEPTGLKTNADWSSLVNFDANFAELTLLENGRKSRQIFLQRPADGKTAGKNTITYYLNGEAVEKAKFVASPCSLDYKPLLPFLSSTPASIYKRFSEILESLPVLDQVFSFESILAEVKILSQNDPLVLDTLIDLKNLELDPRSLVQELLKKFKALCGEAESTAKQNQAGIAALMEQEIMVRSQAVEPEKLLRLESELSKLETQLHHRKEIQSQIKAVQERLEECLDRIVSGDPSSEVEEAQAKLAEARQGEERNRKYAELAKRVLELDRQQEKWSSVPSLFADDLTVEQARSKREEISQRLERTKARILEYGLKLEETARSLSTAERAVGRYEGLSQAPSLMLDILPQLNGEQYGDPAIAQIIKNFLADAKIFFHETSEARAREIVTLQVEIDSLSHELKETRSARQQDQESLSRLDSYILNTIHVLERFETAQGELKKVLEERQELQSALDQITRMAAPVTPLEQEITVAEKRLQIAQRKQALYEDAVRNRERWMTEARRLEEAFNANPLEISEALQTAFADVMFRMDWAREQVTIWKQIQHQLDLIRGQIRLREAGIAVAEKEIALFRGSEERTGLIEYARDLKAKLIDNGLHQWEARANAIAEEFGFSIKLELIETASDAKIEISFLDECEESKPFRKVVGGARNLLIELALNSGLYDLSGQRFAPFMEAEVCDEETYATLVETLSGINMPFILARHSADEKLVVKTVSREPLEQAHDRFKEAA